MTRMCNRIRAVDGAIDPRARATFFSAREALATTALGVDERDDGSVIGTYDGSKVL